MKNQDSLEPKNQTQRLFAVITGASTGIGYELAKQFAEKQYDLLIVSEEGEIVERAQSLRSLGTEVIGLKADLSESKGVEQVYAAIQQAGRDIDVICLNAGVGVNGDFARENKLSDEMRLVGLNVTSVVHLSKLVLPGMIQRGQGKMLITSSIAALMPGPFYATYAASKSFLLSFSEALFNELKDTGVTVTALMPGATDTEFFRRAGMEGTEVAEMKKDDPALVAKQGIEALMAGEDHVIGGSIKNKLQGFIAPFLTEQQRANLQRKSVKPKSTHN